MEPMDYPLGHGEDEVFRLKKQMELLFPSEFTTLIDPQERLLDVGCGSGDLISMLPQSVSYVGLDLKNMVRPVYLNLPNVRIIEADAYTWTPPHPFTFINMRLVLWSVKDPGTLLKKYLHPAVGFFLYEPDDRGLKFSAGLASLEELARHWRAHVMPAGKDPFIGGRLPELLSSSGIRDYTFKEKLFRREGSDLPLLRDAANNLCGIFSKYPGSDALKAECLMAIDGLGSQDWFEEKYCYTYKKN